MQAFWQYFSPLWRALNPELQIFYGIGIIALVILLLQLLISFFLGDSDSFDLDVDGHGDGMGVFSVRGVTAFFIGFGWTGAIILRSGHSLGLAVLGGAVAGIVFMVAIFFMMRSMMKLQTSGTLNYANAVGEVATVYVTIPADTKAGGQVEVMIQGRLMTAEAIYRGSVAISPGTKVQVIDRVGSSTLVVAPLSSSPTLSTH